MGFFPDFNEISLRDVLYLPSVNVKCLPAANMMNESILHTGDIRRMKQRFITGLMLTAFLAINLWLPNWCMALATLICICFAVWEEYHALVTAGHKVVTWPTWVILGASMPLTWLFGVKVIVPLLAMALFTMIAEIRPEHERAAAADGGAARTEPGGPEHDPGSEGGGGCAAVPDLRGTADGRRDGTVCGQRDRRTEALSACQPEEDHCRQHRRPGGQRDGGHDRVRSERPQPSTRPERTSPATFPARFPSARRARSTTQNTP